MIGGNENFTNGPIVDMDENVSNSVFTKTFFWMFLGLLSTAVISWISYSSDFFMELLFNGGFMALLVAEVIVVIAFSALLRKLSPTVAGILYFVYAALNGITLASIFYVYELQSIVLLFAVSCLVFGGFAFYGYKTKKDLTKWSTIVFGALLGVLVVSLLNLFFHNSTLDILIDCVVLLLFFGITIYDVNKIKQLSECDTISQDKLHIYGALQLYLDFINIFLRILALFGKRRN